MTLRILAVNPGSTSTRVAVFDDGREVFSREAPAPSSASAARRAADQAPERLAAVRHELAAAALELRGLSAIAARGGPLAPVPGGTYRVNAAMLADARSERFVDHVSRTGCLVADALARELGIPAFVVDPVSVDEYDEVSRLSGLPELPRRSLTHALSIRASAHRLAAELGRPLAELNLVVAHLGGGISVAALSGGRMIDSLDANGEGPMSPERSGALRADDLVDLCFSGRFGQEELKRRLTRSAGLAGHLGTSDAAEVERRIAAGDERAGLVYEAMALQVAKAVAAMATALDGRVDAVVVTGGLARSADFVARLRRRAGFLGKIVVYPGENEMRALCAGAERVLSGRERARVYPTGEEEPG